jgi:hypothetical protein
MKTHNSRNLVRLSKFSTFFQSHLQTASCFESLLYSQDVLSFVARLAGNTQSI